MISVAAPAGYREYVKRYSNETLRNVYALFYGRVSADENHEDENYLLLLREEFSKRGIRP